jgi:transaldolase
MSTLLAQVYEKVAIDVDSMDPTIAERHTTKTFRFHDMTSNQAIVQAQATNLNSVTIVKEVCAQAKDPELDLEQQISNALDLLVGVLILFYYDMRTSRSLSCYRLCVSRRKSCPLLLDVS